MLGMQRKLCPDAKGLFIAGLVAAALFIFQSPSLQPALIILGGLLGAGLFRQESSESSLTPKQKPKHPVTALAVLLCFISAVVILSSLRPNTDEMTTVIGLAKQVDRLRRRPCRVALIRSRDGGQRRDEPR